MNKTSFSLNLPHRNFVYLYDQVHSVVQEIHTIFKRSSIRFQFTMTALLQVSLGHYYAFYSSRTAWRYFILNILLVNIFEH